MASEIRFLCVGTGEKLTTPRSIRIDSRGYRYALPGKIYFYGGDAVEHQEDDLPGHKLVSAYPGGPVIQGYGMVVITDSYTKVLKTPAAGPIGGMEPNEWETKVITSRDRTQHLLNFWANPFPYRDYGAILMWGELPTEAEVLRARQNRERNAHAHLNEAINDQRLARTGHKANKRGYSNADRAWAFEFGIVLPETVDSMPHVEVSDGRVACPECGEAILPTAKICIHCRTKFKGMTVTEYQQQATETTVAS